MIDRHAAGRLKLTFLAELGSSEIQIFMEDMGLESVASKGQLRIVEVPSGQADAILKKLRTQKKYVESVVELVPEMNVGA